MKRTSQTGAESGGNRKPRPRRVMVVRRVRDWLLDSLFVLPVTLIVIAAGLGALALYIDSTAANLGDYPLILSATVSGGRAIATTVAGATITVAAIVFSITALVTQMAATQYSPRAVAGFFEDMFQQVVIGLVVGTFTFSLVILAGLNDVLDQSEQATPTLSVTLAIVLGVLSAVAIVAYIYHSLRRMQIDSVVRRIAAGAVEAVRRENDSRPHMDITDHSGPPEGKPSKIKAKSGGWIVGIEGHELVDALPPHATARVDVRVGEPISPGDVIATVWASQDGQPLKGRTQRGIRRAIVTDSDRSLESDPTFGIRQLADIALRALSPAVNDPTTAVDVIHHLKVPLREILASEPPLRVLEGPEGRRAFLAQTPSRSDYVHNAFSEIRLSASKQPSVLRALLEVLQDLRGDLEGKDLSGRLAAVEEEFQLTMEAARKADMPDADIQRIVRDHRPEDFEDE